MSACVHPGIWAATTGPAYYGWPSIPAANPTPSAPAAAARLSYKLQPKDAKPGLIAYLPKHAVIDSINQSWVTAGATDHPVCIVGVKNNGRTACVVQMTSMSGQGLEHKYGRSPATLARMQHIYVPIQHGASTYNAHGTVLQLEAGQQMPKQTYINSPAWFDIKTTELELMRAGKKCLDRTSLNKLHQVLSKLIDGHTPIAPLKADGSVPRMPLHRPMLWTLAELGIIIPSAPATVPAPALLSTAQMTQIHQAAKALNAAAKPFTPVGQGPRQMTPMPLSGISHNYAGRRYVSPQQRPGGIRKTPWARVAAA